MQKVLLHNPEKCSGCTLCMLICSFSHFNVCDYALSSIKIVNDPGRKGRFIAIYCSHCEFPICEASCPKNAIKKDKETGIVKINSMLCIGCKTCNVLCPIGVPWFHEKRRVSIKCDLCGGLPYCVRFCSTGALTLVPREEARAKVLIAGGLKA